MMRNKRFFDYTEKQARIALQLVGLTQTDIALEFGVSPQAVHFAIKNPNSSARISSRIEQVIEAANESLNIESLRNTG